MQVNITDVGEFAKLLQLIESGQEEQIIFTRYGKPVVKLVTVEDEPVSRRIGVAKGKLKTPADLDRDNDRIAEMFGEVE